MGRGLVRLFLRLEVLGKFGDFWDRMGWDSVFGVWMVCNSPAGWVSGLRLLWID